MVYERYFERWQLYLLLSGGITVLIFLLVFLPLSRRAGSLDRELAEARVRLTSDSNHGADLLTISGKHQRITESTRSFESALSTLTSRFQISTNTQERLESPFRLVDFEAERYRLISDYLDFAQESGVLLDESLETNLPSYSLAVQKPSQLWAQLEYIRQILFLAIANKVNVIRALKVQKGVSHPAPPFADETWEEIRIHIEMNGRTQSIYQFMHSLPLLNAELEQAGLPAPQPDKPAMSIDQFIVERTSDSPEDIHCEMTIACFLRIGLTDTP